MKRLLSGILAVLYLSTSLGATVHFHYCMGRLTSWGLFDHGSADCSSCGTEKSAGKNVAVLSGRSCCTDEHQLIKTDRDQKYAQAEFQMVKLTPHTAIIYFLTLPSLGISSMALNYPTVNGPPIKGYERLFLLNRSFRI